MSVENPSPHFLGLNNRIVALETKSEYLERDIRDHKEQVEKQFEKLSGRFDKMDTKIDTIVAAVTENKIVSAKIWAIGGVIGAITIAVIGGLVRWMLP